MSIFMDRCAARKPITIFGTGEQTRDFVFIKDLIVAAINLLGQLDKFPIGADAVQQNDPEEVQRSAYTGEGVYPTVFNIGSGISISVNELAELAKIVSGDTRWRLCTGSLAVGISSIPSLTVPVSAMPQDGQLARPCALACLKHGDGQR